jgi:Uma2 family endonuclease
MSTQEKAVRGASSLALKHFDNHPTDRLTDRPTDRPTDRLTLGEYLSMPEGAPYYQFINGKPVSMPSPTLLHQRILRILNRLFDAFVERHRLGEVFFAPLDVYLSDGEYYQPDLIFISNERSHIKQERVQGAPDLVVEILSPSNAEDDLTHKRAVYEAFGVREYWIVNPAERTVTVLANVDGAFQQVSAAQSNDNDDSVESALLAGFRVSLADVFQS